MTTILRIDSSVSGDASVTNRLNQLLVETLDGAATVIHRDVTALPALSADLFVAGLTPPAERTDAQHGLARLSDDIIDELEQADIVVIGAPIYNFGVPSGIKAWMDLAARAGRTFAYTESGPKGLVSGTSAYIVSSSGGVSIGAEGDFATPHLSQFLTFLGIEVLDVIDAGGLMMDATKVEQAEEQIRRLAPA